MKNYSYKNLLHLDDLLIDSAFNDSEKEYEHLFSY